MFLTDSTYCIQIHNSHSYIIIDDKTVVIDTIDTHDDIWLKQIEERLAYHQIDYFILSHKYQANVLLSLCQKYPRMQIITSIEIMHLLNLDGILNPIIIINENDMIDLGHHTLSFMVIKDMLLTYCIQDRILFSSYFFSTEDMSQKWDDNARLFYTQYLNDYHISIQKVLNEIRTIEPLMICPLQGQIIHHNIKQSIRYYDLWSKYIPEENGVLIMTDASNQLVYHACVYLQNELINHGDLASICLISKQNMMYALSQTYKYDRIMIDANIPYVHMLLEQLYRIHLQNRVIGTICMNETQSHEFHNSILLENILLVESIILDNHYQSMMNQFVKTIMEVGCEDGVCG